MKETVPCDIKCKNMITEGISPSSCCYRQQLKSLLCSLSTALSSLCNSQALLSSLSESLGHLCIHSLARFASGSCYHHLSFETTPQAPLGHAHGFYQIPLCCQVMCSKNLEELRSPFFGLTHLSLFLLVLARLEWMFWDACRKPLLEGMIGRGAVGKTREGSCCFTHAAGHVQVVGVAEGGRHW